MKLIGITGSALHNATISFGETGVKTGGNKKVAPQNSSTSINARARTALMNLGNAVKNYRRQNPASLGYPEDTEPFETADGRFIRKGFFISARNQGVIQIETHNKRKVILGILDCWTPWYWGRKHGASIFRQNKSIVPHLNQSWEPFLRVFTPLAGSHSVQSGVMASEDIKYQPNDYFLETRLEKDNSSSKLVLVTYDFSKRGKQMSEKEILAFVPKLIEELLGHSKSHRRLTKAAKSRRRLIPFQPKVAKTL